MQTLDGTILTEDGWVDGRLHFDESIASIDGDAVRRPGPPYILPGFVDLHVHGGGGADMMAGPDAIRTAAKLHGRHGTTSLLATSVTAPAKGIAAFLDAVRAHMEASDSGGARVIGAHLEGPFISPDKLGAQPPFAIGPDAELLRSWLERAAVRVVTFAPEIDPEDALLDVMVAAGVRPQIGHSLCGYAQATRCMARGCGVTHLFNAMSGVSHRGNGIAGAALAHAGYAEIIPDLIHVEAGAILAARRAIPHLYGVTDATAGAGVADGEFQLGTLTATKKDGAMRLADGTLAGSALTMDAALRNLVSIGLPLGEAARRLSTLPADWLGLADIGRLAAGARADLVVLDHDLRVSDVWVAGAPVT